MFVILAVAIFAGTMARHDLPSFRFRRRRPRVDEQRYLAAVHGELRAGASLRQALADAALGQDCPPLPATRRLALAGAPIERLAESLRRLPGNGRRIGAAIEVAGLSGGRSADVFLGLANRAAAQADLERQQKILTTQARVSALVVGGLPLLWLAFGGVGRLQALVQAGAGAVALVGFAMETVGALLVWRLAS